MMALIPPTESSVLLEFQRGDRSRPRGHALAYYRDAQAGDIYATYLIVPPIAIDIAKYMPPMFASKVSLADMETVSAIPLPPVPEKVSGVEYLRHLAESREDDLVFLGAMNSSDVQSILVQVAEAAQEYLRTYNVYLGTLPSPDPAREEAKESVQDVLYSLMSERDKLAELAKLIGKLRYAVDGGDARGAEDAAAEIRALGTYLSGKYRVDDLIAGAKQPGARGRHLSELYMTRCYRLSDEDYRAVEQIDGEIRQADSAP